jgi:hypothetical protein
MEGMMLEAIEHKPVTPERTPEAIDFSDRLGLLKHDVTLIELATEALAEHYNGPEQEVEAIVMACRRLYGDLDALVDQVLPPMPKAEIKRIEAITRQKQE